MGRLVGNQTTVGFGSNGTPMATSSAHLGTPSVGNMHVSGGASGPALNGRSLMPVPGTLKTVPVDIAAKIPARAAAKVILRGALSLTGVGLMVPAGLEIYDFLKNEMQLDNVKNENGEIVAEKTIPPTNIIPGGFRYQIGSGPIVSSPHAACDSFVYPGGGIYELVGQSANADGTLCVGVLKMIKPPTVVNPDYGERIKKIGGSCPAGTTQVPEGCRQDGATTKTVSQQEIEDMIAAKSGWPTSSTKALVEALKIPAVGKTLETAPATVTGPATVPGEKTTTTESVKLVPGTTTEAAPGTTTPTQPGTKTTTKTETQKLTYAGNTVTTNNTTTNTTTSITNNVTNETKIEGDKTEVVEEKKEPQEFETCGLPGKPKCQIDELDTPAPKEDTAKDDVEAKAKPLDDFIKNPEAVLPQLPTINWAFQLPSGCSSIPLPAFDPWLQEIDVCRFQPTFHDIMSLVWIIGGLFGAIGIFWRNTFAQG